MRFFDKGGCSKSLPLVLSYSWSHFYVMLSSLFSHLDVRCKIMVLMMLVALPFSVKTLVKVLWAGFRLTKCHCLQ